jgi:hypothetical protein
MIRHSPATERKIMANRIEGHRTSLKRWMKVLALPAMLAVAAPPCEAITWIVVYCPSDNEAQADSAIASLHRTFPQWQAETDAGRVPIYHALSAAVAPPSPTGVNLAMLHPMQPFAAIPALMERSAGRLAFHFSYLGWNEFRTWFGAHYGPFEGDNATPGAYSTWFQYTNRIVLHGARRPGVGRPSDYGPMRRFRHVVAHEWFGWSAARANSGVRPLVSLVFDYLGSGELRRMRREADGVVFPSAGPVVGAGALRRLAHPSMPWNVLHNVLDGRPVPAQARLGPQTQPWFARHDAKSLQAGFEQYEYGLANEMPARDLQGMGSLLLMGSYMPAYATPRDILWADDPEDEADSISGGAGECSGQGKRKRD